MKYSFQIRVIRVYRCLTTLYPRCVSTPMFKRANNSRSRDCSPCFSFPLVFLFFLLFKSFHGGDIDLSYSRTTATATQSGEEKRLFLVPIMAQLTRHPATLIATYTRTHTLTLRNCFVIARNDAAQTVPGNARRTREREKERISTRGITAERNIWRHGETRLLVRGYSRRSLNSRRERAAVFERIAGGIRYIKTYRSCTKQAMVGNR